MTFKIFYIFKHSRVGVFISCFTAVLRMEVFLFQTMEIHFALTVSLHLWD